MTDFAGSWTEKRDCENKTWLEGKLKITITEDGCAETKGIGVYDGESTLCYCHTDLCNSSERIHILNTKTWFCGFLILLYSNISYWK